jgi:ATP-binding cassette, subfamily B, bacterial
MDTTNATKETTEQIAGSVGNLESLEATLEQPILEIKNLSFSYGLIENGDKLVLEDISLMLEKGKKYALIGPTGEGKSTMAMLMAGLIKPQIGEVLYKGKPLLDYSQQEISKSIGFILQDPFLFEGSVAENIIYGLGCLDELGQESRSENLGNPQTIENIKEKAKTKVSRVLEGKGLSHLIDSFADGLDTEVKNGSENVSLGQKQIVNFLRAIIRSPELLILDEATANLDTITEGYLQSILANLTKGTTLVIIAHRLNTVKNVDVKFQVGGRKVKVI